VCVRVCAYFLFFSSSCLVCYSKKIIFFCFFYDLVLNVMLCSIWLYYLGSNLGNCKRSFCLAVLAVLLLYCGVICTKFGALGDDNVV